MLNAILSRGLRQSPELKDDLTSYYFLSSCICLAGSVDVQLFSIKSFKDSFLSLQDSSWIIEILNRITFIIMDNVFNNVRFGRNIIIIINILIIIYETTFSFKRSMFDIVAIFINFTLGLFLTFICYSSCYYFVIYKIGPSLSSQKLLEVL